MVKLLQTPTLLPRATSPARTSPAEQLADPLLASRRIAPLDLLRALPSEEPMSPQSSGGGVGWMVGGAWWAPPPSCKLILSVLTEESCRVQLTGDRHSTVERNE